jgi:hypothetical protein
MAAMGDAGAIVMGLLVGIAYIFMLVLQFMLTIQRAHDFNSSGWMSLLLFVPLAPLIFWFIPGTDGSNQYGAPPPPNSGGIVALFVTGILGLFVLPILAAIAIPAYQGYVEKAQQIELQQQR